MRATVQGRRGRPLWVLAGEGGNDLMTLSDGGGGEALLVFGFEEEARLFLRLLGAQGSWRAREAAPEELARLLRGPYAGVGKVALDPVPAGVDSSGPLDVTWPSPEAFLGAVRMSGGTD